MEKEQTIINTINMYVLTRITNLFDADEITERYAQKLAYITAYSTAEEILGEDAPEEDKEFFIEHIIPQKDKENTVKELKNTLENNFSSFRNSMKIK